MAKLILREFLTITRSIPAAMRENQGAAKQRNTAGKVGAHIAVSQRMGDEIRPEKAPADIDVPRDRSGNGLVASQ